MNSCVYIPQVKNKKGEVVDSILFKDIKGIVKDYDIAWNIYGKTLNEEFLNRTSSFLQYDVNGEPTLESIIQQTNLLSHYEEGTLAGVIKKEETKLGKYNSKGEVKYIPNTYTNKVEYARKVIKYNENRPSTGKLSKDNLVATLNTSGNGITPEISKSTGEKELASKKAAARLNLYGYLSEYLGKYGVGVGVIDSTLDLYAPNANGVIDFSEVPKFAQGLVTLIKLAKGEAGKAVLPEEFSHFIISATSGNLIIDRLIKNIRDNNLAEIILGEEYETVKKLQEKQPNLYGVEKEAAGKLLAMALEGKDINEVSKSLIERGKTIAKDTFSNMDLNSLIDSIREALMDVSALSDEIFAEEIQGTVSINNITDKGLYYNLGKAIDKQKESVKRKQLILKAAIDNEVKKFRISEKTGFQRGKNYDYTALLSRMRTNLLTKEELKGIYDFIQTELEFCKDANEKMAAMRNGTFDGNRHTELRHIRTQWKSCCGILQEIEADILEDDRAEIKSYSEDIRKTFEELKRVLTTLAVDYTALTQDEAVSFFRTFLGDEVAEAYKEKATGWTQTRVFKPEDIFNIHNINVNDITATELWLDAARDSRSFILQAYDKAIKIAKEKSRMKTLETMRDLMAAQKKLEKAGIKDTDWMYEKDSNGKLTGNFVTEWEEFRVRKDRNSFYEALNKKYGDRSKLSQAQKELRNQEIKEFERSLYLHRDASVTIYNPKYSSKAYKEIMSDPNKKEYYEKVMKLKADLDESAGLISRGYTAINHAPRILRDLLQRVKNSDSVKSGAKTMQEALRDAFVRRSDDTDFGVMGQAALVDFEDREVNLLPLYYLKLNEKEDLNDISRDTTSTMIAYADMINNYNCIGEVIDQMENARDVMSDKVKVNKLKNGTLLSQIFKGIVGDSETASVVQQDFNASNLGKRLDLYLKMSVYGQEYKDEGTVKIPFTKAEVSKAKIGGLVMGMTAFTGLALNTLAAIANATLNVVNINTEAHGGRWFGKGNLWRADKFFDKHFLGLMGELESRTKTNMISLLNQEYNITQDLDKDLRDVKARKKTWLSRAFNGRTLYFMTTAGDNWAYFRTAFAILDRYKVKLNGEEISLLNAYEKVYIDPDDHSLGAYLKLKDGVTKLDGSEFTEKDKQDLKAEIDYVNQEMFGIYNSADKNTLQRTAIGRMAIMYRKYMRPNWNRRFKGRRKIAALNEFDEGYYTTLGRFVSDLFKDIKKGEFLVASKWSSLEDWEKKNLRKVFAEVVQFGVAAMFAFLLFKDPKKEDPWIKRLVAYQSRRLFMEIGAFVPGPTMITEGTNLLKSPSATINTLENTTNLIGLLNPYNYTERLQSGRYKGKTKAHKILFNSPIGLQGKSIYRFTHPEEAYSFFTSW